MTEKKQSLFLKSLKSNPKIIDTSKGFPSVITISQTSPPINSTESQSIIQKSKIFGVSDDEYSKISKESSIMVLKMSENEIKESQKELLDTLDPKLLAFFQNTSMKNQKKEIIPQETQPKLDKKKDLDYFFEVFFDNDGKEVKGIEKTEESEAKIELFCEKQEHSLDNLVNILERFPSNAAVVGFSLFKLEKILQEFYVQLKENNEFIEFNEIRTKVYRNDFIKYLIKDCFIYNMLLGFLMVNNQTVNANVLKILRVLLKIIIGQNFSIFLQVKIRKTNMRG